MNHPYTTAIILAGGSGTRLGSSTPKQLLPLLGKPLLYHTVKSFAHASSINALVVVSRAEDMEVVSSLATEAAAGKPVFFANGGDTRMASLLSGLSAVPAESRFIAIHDGARCLIHPSDIDTVTQTAYQEGSATAVKPLTDTIKQKDQNGLVCDTLDRNTLWLAQTPQVFRKSSYLEALAAAGADAHLLTDDNRLFELMGQSIPAVVCTYENEKITYQKDLAYAEFVLQNRQSKGKGKMSVRIGHGYDVHRLVEERPLMIGGVNIPHEKGLDGHSDADVLVHAIMDALLGAAGLPDIGNLFPDHCAEFKNISSLLLLEKVRETLENNGFSVVNIDATIVAQAPKMAPHIPEMKQKIAATLGCSEDVVNVKATTEEKLGFTGAQQGISAHAVCLIEK